MTAVTIAPVGKLLSKRSEQIERLRHYLKLSLVGVLAIVLLWFIVTFIAAPYEVNGISMQPTFYTGDIVLVWKLPQTWTRLTNSQYMPKRGQLIVIKKTSVSGEQLIKRVIGLPKDTVVISNGNVTVYNPFYPNGFNPDAAPFGKDLLPTYGNFYTQVGVGQVFVLGDNRTVGASIDSRSGLGNVASRNIIGQVILRLYPLNKFKLF